MRIPLPKMMRHYRVEEFDKQLNPPVARKALKLWSYFATRPKLYRFATRVAMGVLGFFGRQKGRFKSLPLAKGWTDVRDMPAPEGHTFHALYKAGRRR